MARFIDEEFSSNSNKDSYACCFLLVLKTLIRVGAKLYRTVALLDRSGPSLMYSFRIDLNSVANYGQVS